MKTSIAILLSFVCCIQIIGKQVDFFTAQKAGQHFLAANPQTQTLIDQVSLELVFTAASAPDPEMSASAPENYYYIFNNKTAQGFVIIAADDIVFPVLAYSTGIDFDPDNVPPAMLKWLEGYKDQIRYAIENNLLPTEDITTLWKELTSGNQNFQPTTRLGVNPLIKTKWDQSPYYNTLCPYDTEFNKRTITGCVATAMAQVMKFWNYPAKGTGFHSYNHDKYGTLSAPFGNTTYQWSLMPNTVSATNNAVATLMYHCGVSVNMNYGVNASGAYTLDVVNALKEYFGYDVSVTGHYRENYTDTQWKTLLKTELDAGRPMEYAGSGNGGGHAFVCDGYDNNDFFHFNWGWGGSSDGYFNMNALNPGSLGSGGGTGGYNSNQRVITGIKPPAGSGSQTYNLKLYNFITVSPASISYSSPFTVSTNIWNTGTGVFTGDYCAAVFNEKWDFIDFVEIRSGLSLNAGYVYNPGLDFSSSGLSSMLPGIYYIGIYFRPTGGNWVFVDDNGNYKNFIQIEVYHYDDISTNSLINVTPDALELIKGKPISAKVNIRNDGTSRFYGTYSIDLYDLDGDWVTEIASITESSGLPSGHTYSNPLTFNSDALDAPAGTYYLVVMFKPDGGEWKLAGSAYYQNPIYAIIKEASLLPDIYEPNNGQASAKLLSQSYTNNVAKIKTTNSNCHTGLDYDYYKLNFSSGYNYTITGRLQDGFNSNDGLLYTLDALVSYSTDGTNWSEAFDDVITGNIIVGGGKTVYFYVAPFFSGETGTYLLDLKITRTPATYVEENNNEEKVIVFPNPAKDLIMIDLAGLENKTGIISLYNLQGREVFNTKISGDIQILKIPFHQDYSPGVYLLKLQTNKGIIVKKVMIDL